MNQLSYITWSWFQWIDQFWHNHQMLVFLSHHVGSGIVNVDYVKKALGIVWIFVGDALVWMVVSLLGKENSLPSSLANKLEWKKEASIVWIPVSSDLLLLTIDLQFDIWLPSNSCTSFQPNRTQTVTNRNQPTPQPPWPWTKVSMDLTTFHTSITQFLCSHGTMCFMSSHATNVKLRNLQLSCVWWWRPLTKTDLVLLVRVEVTPIYVDKYVEGVKTKSWLMKYIYN